jgi:hypothetical protein
MKQQAVIMFSYIATLYQLLRLYNLDWDYDHAIIVYGEYVRLDVRFIYR